MRILNRITGNVIKFKSFSKFVSNVRVGIIDHEFNIEYHLPTDNCLEKQSYLACDNIEQLREDFLNTKKSCRIMTLKDIEQVANEAKRDYNQDVDTMVRVENGVFALVDSSDWILYKTKPLENGSYKMGLVTNKLAPLYVLMRM